MMLALALSATSDAAPPPIVAIPPYVTTGSFRCDVKDRKGQGFTVTGSNRDARKTSDGETSVFDIEAPGRLRISGEYYARNRGDSFAMKNWLTSSNTYVHADRATNVILIGEPRRPNGTIFISTRGKADAGQDDVYVGFCDFAFSAKPQQVIQ